MHVDSGLNCAKWYDLGDQSGKYNNLETLESIEAMCIVSNHFIAVWLWSCNQSADQGEIGAGRKRVVEYLHFSSVEVGGLVHVDREAVNGR